MENGKYGFWQDFGSWLDLVLDRRMLLESCKELFTSGGLVIEQCWEFSWILWKNLPHKKCGHLFKSQECAIYAKEKCLLPPNGNSLKRIRDVFCILQ